MPIKEFKYNCQKRCIVKGCFRNDVYIPTHEFGTDHKTKMQKHNDSKTHLGTKRDLKAHIACAIKGCTYSTSDLSHLQRHELAHEKEAKLGRPSEKTASVEETKVSSFVDEVIKDNLHLYF